MRRLWPFGALIVLAACAKAPQTAVAPASAAIAPLDLAAGAPQTDPLTDRLWVLSPEDGRPGVIRVFLSSGAFFQGSCAETYRVSAWSRNAEGKIVWNEDGEEISADILSIDDAELVISVNLRDGRKVETYRRAPVPFTCPDLPR